MTHGAPMPLPPGRALPGWWRELAGLSPRRLAVAHLALHRVEALVEAAPRRALAALAAAARARASGRVAPTEDLAAELAVDRALLAAALRQPQGEAAPVRQRRTFWFLDAHPPVYLPLAADVTAPLDAPADWHFEVAALEACVAAPDQWKARHGFPPDVRAVARHGEAGEWRHVVLDRAEQVVLGLAQRSDGSVVGHAVGDAGALLRPAVLSVAAGEELLGPLLGETGPDALRAAWQAWCQARSLPGAEVEACGLELRDHRLIVRPPLKLLDRLRQARSEALRGDVWLLVGGGRARLAAQVDVVG